MHTFQASLGKLHTLANLNSTSTMKFSEPWLKEYPPLHNSHLIQFLLFITTLLNIREKKGWNKQKTPANINWTQGSCFMIFFKNSSSEKIFEVDIMTMIIRALFIEDLLPSTEHFTGFLVYTYHCIIPWSVFYSLHFPDEETEDHKSSQGHPWPDTLAHRMPSCKLEKCPSRQKHPQGIQV